MKLAHAATMLVLGLSILTACATTSHQPVDPESAQESREQFLRRAVELQRGYAASLASRLNRETEAMKAAGDSELPTLDFLVVSGGGENGAFGAGFLNGWGNIQNGAFARPEFDVVTGVSTGSLIAPYALIGNHDAYHHIEMTYRDVEDDYAKIRGLFFFLPKRQSFYSNEKLREKIRGDMDDAFIQKLKEAAEQDRKLLVATTDLDMGALTIWDLTEEARTGASPERIQDILIGSAAIPAVFPPVMIDDRLHVDGGASQNFFLGASTELFSGVMRDLGTTSEAQRPFRVRIWIVLNTKLHAEPAAVNDNWVGIAKRSLETLNKSAGLLTLRGIRDLARLIEYDFPHIQTEFRYVAIPEDAELGKPTTLFDPEVTARLSNLGEQMGQSPESWQEEIPLLQP